MMLPAIVDLLGELDQEHIDALLGSLSVEEAARIAFDWELWSLPYQQLPAGNWRRWLLRCE